MEGLSETLASEVADFGIRVTLVEPNGFATEWGGSSAIQTTAMKDYEPVKKAFTEGATPDFYGKPEATTDAILQLVDTSNPPLRLILGKVAYPVLKEVYKKRLAEWEEWKEVSDKAHGF